MDVTCGGKISLSVDLRSQLSDIRDQGARPLCIICAASDVHEGFHATGFALSAEYLAYYCQKYEGINCFKDGFCVNTVENVMANDGQPSESFHPYANHSLISAVKPPALGSELVLFGKLVDKKLNITHLIECLDNSRLVLIGMKITKDFLDVTNSNFIIGNTRGFLAMHAMVITGYGDYNSNKVFLLRNSWGVGWGNQGYAWVDENYLNRYCLMMACVEKR